jgi:hypothetical protein
VGNPTIPTPEDASTYNPAKGEGELEDGIPVCANVSSSISPPLSSPDYDLFG